MKKRIGVILAVMAVLTIVTDVEATKMTRGPDPGFVAQVSYTGIPAPGAILSLTCRFSLPSDSLGAKEHDSLMKELLSSPDDNSLKWENEFIDSVFFWADTNIEILGPLSWKGRIEPGQEYVFTTTIRLKREYISQGYFGAITRYGSQPLGRLAFFTDKLRIPVGYVTDVIVDSLGNYWHKHRSVMDATLKGFVPFDSTKALPPDTSFDKTGKILLIIQVLDPSSGKLKIKPHGEPLRLEPGLKQFQQKPTQKAKKDDSFGILDTELPRETVASKPSPPLAPGIKGEITVAGDERAGSTVEVICSFMIPPDAHGVKELEALMGGDYLSAGIDSVLFYSDTNIVILTDPVWRGKMVPGVNYGFNVSILLKDGFEGNLYVAAFTRYGIQSIGYVPFFFGKRPRPLGYVVDIIVDNLGNYWHKHRSVIDCTLKGFVPFDSSKALPPDTSFDKTGKILLIIQVLDPSSGKLKIKPHGEPLRLEPGLKQFQRKPNRKSSKDESLGIFDTELPHETVASKSGRSGGLSS